MTYPKTMLEKFNETDGRGDVLSLAREDVARLYALPVEIYAPIVHALFGWFLNGDANTLDDPRDNAMLEGFKEHQLANAWKRKAFLEKQNANANMRRSQKAMASHGNPTRQVKEEDEDKDKVNKSLSSSVGVKRSRTDAATFTPDSGDSVRMTPAKARKFLAMNVPDGRISTIPCFINPNGRVNAFYLELFAEGVSSSDRIGMVSDLLHEELSESEREKVRKSFDEVLEDRLETMESERLDGFDAALMKAYYDTLDGGCRNPDALVIDRINKTISAKRTLAKDGK